MREIRQSGSEGGGATHSPYPYLPLSLGNDPGYRIKRTSLELNLSAGIRSLPLPVLY